MGNRWQRLLSEGSRFLAVGGVATAVALFLFNLLVHGLSSGQAPLADHVILAYVLANTAGMVVSYRGSRQWAFRDRVPVHSDGGRTAFVLINVVTMTLPIACLSFSRQVLGLDDPVSDNVSANVIGLSMGLGARFYLFRRFVFRRPVHLLHLHHHPGEIEEVERRSHVRDEIEDLRRRLDVSGPTAPATSVPAPPSSGGPAGG